MRWLARRSSGAQTAVAANLAEFLAQATEGGALRQAIGNAHSTGDEFVPASRSNETVASEETGTSPQGSFEGRGTGGGG